MEESIKIEEAIAKALKLEEVDPRTYSPLVRGFGCCSECTGG